MTSYETYRREKSFVPDVLPWLVAAAALLGYLLTLNHWVSMNSLLTTSQVAGWGWPQNFLGPVHFLATYPLRWLSPAWLPLGFNVFTALCAAATLGQLARAIALLPHDRTQAQREREFNEFSLLTTRTAWLPVVLATVVCGLQLSFWENAIVGTGEMLDLLLVAYVVRCLLEFRIDGRDSRLTRAALVFGAAMANQSLMILMLPLFLAALLWIKGLGFFNFRFLVRMALVGLAGLALCLLMPWIQSHAVDAGGTYWEMLRFNLGNQKNFIFGMPLKDLSVLAITSLVPLLVMSIRWAASSGDNSPTGIALGSFLFHVGHAALLLMCLWVAFDPPFSPRMYPRQVGVGLSFLPLYFLSALGVGYYSGYLLLIFGKRNRNLPHNSSTNATNTLVKIGVWLLLLAVPAGLLYKNLPQIQASRDRTLGDFATLLVADLPQQSAVVLSDDPRFSFLAEAALHRNGAATKHIILNTYALTYPPYHRFLQHTFAPQWHDDLGTNQPQTQIQPAALIELLTAAAKTHEIYYLHPSFGYYFEKFYPETRGLISRLHLYPDKTVSPPPPTEENIAHNRTFWERDHADALQRVAKQLSDKPNSGARIESRFSKIFNLRREPNSAALWAGSMYSRSLNSWGITLQQNNQITPAGWCFQRAIELNPGNVAAEINLGFNGKLRASDSSPFKLTKPMEDHLAGFRNWEIFLRENGPLDEPQYCYQQGVTFTQGGLYREAAAQFLRARQLSPDNLGTYLWLAQIYNFWQLSDTTLELIRDARALPSAALAEPATQIELASAEATAYFNKNQPALATSVLQNTLAKLPKNETALNVALRLYLTYQHYTNALAIVEQQLQLNPDDPAIRNNQAFVCLQLQRYDQAIPLLDRTLADQPGNAPALLNRAIAHLQVGHLAEARQDYAALQLLAPDAHQIYYGLGEIAYLQKDKTNAIANYKLYLEKAPPHTDEAKLVAARLKELQSP